MSEDVTIHPQVGDVWRYGGGTLWTITEVRADGKIYGRRGGVGAAKERPLRISLDEPHRRQHWKRIQAATPEPGHRADPAPEERTGILALRCKKCLGAEWRPARDDELSLRTRKRALFVCITCERHGDPISVVTNDLYERSPLLAPVTLKALEERLATEAAMPVEISDEEEYEQVMAELCGCGHERRSHDGYAGDDACAACPCERFHAFCECGHAQSQHSDGGHGPGNGVCCAFPPELTGTDQCPCTNFRPKRST